MEISLPRGYKIVLQPQPPTLLGTLSKGEWSRTSGLSREGVYYWEDHKKSEVDSRIISQAQENFETELEYFISVFIDTLAQSEGHSTLDHPFFYELFSQLCFDFFLGYSWHWLPASWAFDGQNIIVGKKSLPLPENKPHARFRVRDFFPKVKEEKCEDSSLEKENVL